MENTKNKILESAFILFLEYGFSSVSFQDIIKKSEISTGTFYYHFKTKEEVAYNVIDKYIINYFKDSLKRSKEFEGTYSERLQFLLQQVVALDNNTKKSVELYTNSDINDYRKLHLLLFEGVQKYESLAKSYSYYSTLIKEYMIEIIVEGKENNEIRDDIIAEEAVCLIHSVMVGTYLLWIGSPNIDIKRFLYNNMYHIWSYLEKKD